jgi:glucosylceramidase
MLWQHHLLTRPPWQAGDQWKELPELKWSTRKHVDEADQTVVAYNRTEHKQHVMGFGSAMTDTSAYNAMVWMNDETRDDFFEALWGKTGLGELLNPLVMMHTVWCEVFVVYWWLPTTHYTSPPFSSLQTCRLGYAILAGLSLGRVTLNSADYSYVSFNYDNHTDDFALKHFDHTLAYDHQRVVPMIKRALSTAAAAWNDTIKLFASPWSPPGWMKQNGNMINSAPVCLKDDTAAGNSYKQTWANYILAWLDGYAAAGLPMWGLTPQNEPEARQHKFESCAYTPELMVSFIGEHLGPTVLAKYPELQIIGFDHNKLHSLEWMQAIYGNATTNAMVSGTAVHWYDYSAGPIPGGDGGGGLALGNLDAIHALEPSKFILNTEACTLFGLKQDWKIATLYMVDIVGDLNHWTNGWMFWNSALLEGDKYPYAYGGPNHDNTTSFGDPLLFEFDRNGTQRIDLQPSYWVLGHFSRFARPGDRVVGSGGAGVATTMADYNLIRALATVGFELVLFAGFPVVQVLLVLGDATIACFRKQLSGFDRFLLKTFPFVWLCFVYGGSR